MDSKGSIQASEKLNLEENEVVIKIASEITSKLQTGANSIKVFAISNSVLKPDFYESSFLVTENIEKLPLQLLEMFINSSILCSSSIASLMPTIFECSDNISTLSGRRSQAVLMGTLYKICFI